MLLNQAKKKNRKPIRVLLPLGRRLLLTVLMAGLPGAVISTFLLWTNSYSLDHKLEITVGLLVFWIGMSFYARNAVIRGFQLLSNVVAALKTDDYSFRTNQELQGDAFGDLAMEINELSRALEGERLGTIDNANLLRQIMAEVGAAIMAFSPDGCLYLVNDAGAGFLDAPEGEIIGRSAKDLGIGYLFEGPTTETISRRGSHMEEMRWIKSRKQFRRNGQVHQLVVLSEASEALHAEERLAWQRLIRVLSHEINNSLAPVKSIARTLRLTALDSTPPGEKKENLAHGLEVIGGCAESLNTFVQNYARATKLPPPQPRKIALETLLARVVALEARVAVTVTPGPSCEVNIDPDQLQQALINLVRNGVDSMLMHHSTAEDHGVTISWTVTNSHVHVYVKDCGVGLAATDNLFVPFYTTKEGGSGIGLFLSRQIVEAHGGVLRLSNRSDRRGCEVEVRLPLDTQLQVAVQ